MTTIPDPFLQTLQHLSAIIDKLKATKATGNDPEPMLTEALSALREYATIERESLAQLHDRLTAIAARIGVQFPIQ